MTIPRITIIDQQRLFQFKDNNTSKNQEILYSNNSQYIKNTFQQLSEVWNNSQTPSAITLDSIINSPKIEPQLLLNEPVPSSLRKIENIVVSQKLSANQQLTEKAIIQKIIDAQKKPANTDKDSLIIQYGNAGQAIIYPPKNLNLPNLLFYMFHNDKHSTHEAQDYLIICTEQKTLNGSAFLPAAFIYDNPEETTFWKKLWAGIKFSKNMLLVEKDKLQIEVHGNALFAGWTIPIPLGSSSSVLPPACIILEGYGNVKPGTHTVRNPSGYVLAHEYNGFDAYVTFLHSATKYEGPGTQGFVGRENITTVYQPT
jgi:hypothetical protein